MNRLATSLLLLLVTVPSLAASTVVTDIESRISAIELADGQFAPDLVNPLTELAAHHASTDQLAASLELYRRAQNILHRQEGIHTRSQIPIVNHMIGLAVQLGDIDQASQMHVLLYTIYKQHYGEAHPQTIAALVALADWYQIFGHHDRANELLGEALDTVGEDTGSGKLRWQVELSRLNSKYLQGRCCSNRLVEASLHDLLSDPSTDLAERKAGLLKAADLLTIAGHKNAENYYKAHLSLSPMTATPAVPLGIARNDLMVRAYLRVVSGNRVSTRLPRGQLSGSPLAFCQAQLVELSEEPVESFRLSADLSVSRHGRVEDVAIVNATAPRTVVRLFKHIARLTRFRPAFDNGEPVESVARIEQDFADEVDLVSDGLPLAPANIATFHGCHMLATVLEPPEGGPRIATVQ